MSQPSYPQPKEAMPSAASRVVPTAAWVPVCEIDDIIPGTGVAALLNGVQIALIRPTSKNEVYAISNFDPFSKAFVISRGIVGDRGGVLKVASPIFKQNFDLKTGQCMDDATVRLPVYPVRVIDGTVEVLPEPQETS